MDNKTIKDVSNILNEIRLDEREQPPVKKGEGMVMRDVFMKVLKVSRNKEEATILLPDYKKKVVLPFSYFRGYLKPTPEQRKEKIEQEKVIDGFKNLPWKGSNDEKKFEEYAKENGGSYKTRSVSKSGYTEDVLASRDGKMFYRIRSKQMMTKKELFDFQDNH